MTNIHIRFSISCLLSTIMLTIVSCGNHNPAWEKMALADSLMETVPDSTLAVLKSIPASDLDGKKGKARYALLTSMALDKNYIDTTTFDILQPAIDYYPDKGTPDEKLRTYYYQGRIFQNKGDRDNALNSFIKATDLASKCSDSLVLARALVAQGILYKDFYDFDGYADASFKAADIYKDLGRSEHEFDCLLRVLNGAIVMQDKTLADRALERIHSFEPFDDTKTKMVRNEILLYTLNFKSREELKLLIDSRADIIDYDANELLTLAWAYNRLADNDKARQLLEYVDKSGADYDSLKYLSTSVNILRDLGDYKAAFSAYWDFVNKLDSTLVYRFEQKAKSTDEKHSIELKAQDDARRKSNIIQWCVSGIIISVLIIILLVRSNRSQKKLAIQIAKAGKLENEKLEAEKMMLALENKNLQLERDKNALEAENLTHRVESLEAERDSLRKLLAESEKLPEEVQNSIRVRLEMLNSLLASHISDNEQYGKSYEIWVKELTDDTEKFMDSNRLAFQASHPKFIQYFEEHGLTVGEINYVCLYAIGLRGREVGDYMKKRSHVNISSAIRKKLGLDKHETNIGIYVRKLLQSL